MAPRIRREQICSRCRNHGKLSVLKNHKKFCPFLVCDCNRCNETRDRQQFIAREIRFHRKKQKDDDITKGVERAVKKIPSLKLIDDDIATTSAACEVRRHQMCARCRNHDQHNPIKGHKNNCMFASCECEKCVITEERRKIMAKQIRENRSNKMASDEDDGYSGSPPGSSDKESEGFKFQVVEERAPPQLQRIDELRAAEAATDEKEMFYIVQSLYEKCFVHGDSTSRLEVLYAFVMLSQGNWPVINESLSHGRNFIELTFVLEIKI
jgi:hypothetical protein